MKQYFTDILKKDISSLELPQLIALARDNDILAALKLCKQILAIGMYCLKNREFIKKIQIL
ncbi:hypothetical protein BDP27DRAFT_1151895, partial [Rhodocollybia butyracea]